MRLPLLVPALSLLAALTACTDTPDPAPPATSTVEETSESASTSAGPAAAPAGRLETRELDDGGEARRYDVYAPPAAGTPLPVVVVLPGTGVALETLRETTQFDRLADAEDFLVVYVDAPEAGFDARLCCGGTDRDVDFVLAVLDDVEADWPLDRSRVYASGFSAGAAMSYKLAVRAPGDFAAVAPVSGGFYPDPRVDDPESAVPDQAPSVISFAGTADPDYDDIAGGVALWRLGATCDRPAATSVDGAEGVLGSVADCGASDVTFYTVEGMGHAWPGGTGDGFGDTGSGLDASGLIWAFFAVHSLR